MLLFLSSDEGTSCSSIVLEQAKRSQSLVDRSHTDCICTTEPACHATRVAYADFRSQIHSYSSLPDTEGQLDQGRREGFGPFGGRGGQGGGGTAEGTCSTGERSLGWKLSYVGRKISQMDSKWVVAHFHSSSGFLKKKLLSYCREVNPKCDKGLCTPYI